MASQNGKAAAIGVVTLLAIGGAVFFLIRYILTDSSPTVVVVPANTAGRTGPSNAGSGVAVPAATVAGPKGMVRGLDGKAIAGADVLLAMPREVVMIFSPGRSNVPTIKTDDQGRFAFPTVTQWDAIVVRCDAGYSQMLADQLDASKGEIVLQPWGRLKGRLLAGTKPVANEQVSLDRMYDPDLTIVQPGQPARSLPISYRQTATTDADGRFAFPQVVAGELSLGRNTPAVQGLRMISHIAYVHMEPGKTVQVTVGGTGRPVIGSVVATGAEEPLNFTGRIVPVRAVGPISTRPTTQEVEIRSQLAAQRTMEKPVNWDQLSPDEQRRLVAKWEKRPWYASASHGVIVGRDGSFRADDIPAGSYYLMLTADAGSSSPGGGGYAPPEILATLRTQFTVPEMPGGRSDEPLDLGKLTTEARKRLAAGQAAAELEGKTLDGAAWKLSEQRGKYVLIQNSGMPSAYMNVSAGGVSRPDPTKELWDRFSSDKRFTMVGLYPGGSVELIKAALAKDPVPWNCIIVPRDASSTPYVSSPGLLLIDPQGNIALRTTNIISLYASLEVAMGKDTAARPDVKVAVEHIPGEKATAAFAFKTVPTISKVDAGQQAVFSIVDGRKAAYGAGLRALNDGLGPRSPEDEAGEMCFDDGTLEGRLRADLGKAIPISQVNTFSWYKNGNRWPQVYRLYASDGAAAGFNPEPKFGIDPAACGWTYIASVDTRPTAGGADLRDGVGGQDAVSISGAGGTAGNYRYLLFEVFATQTQTRWMGTFYSEIDIVEKR